MEINTFESAVNAVPNTDPQWRSRLSPKDRDQFFRGFLRVAHAGDFQFVRVDVFATQAVGGDDFTVEVASFGAGA